MIGDRRELILVFAIVLLVLVVGESVLRPRVVGPGVGGVAVGAAVLLLLLRVNWNKTGKIGSVIGIHGIQCIERE